MIKIMIQIMTGPVTVTMTLTVTVTMTMTMTKTITITTKILMITITKTTSYLLFFHKFYEPLQNGPAVQAPKAASIYPSLQSLQQVYNIAPQVVSLDLKESLVGSLRKISCRIYNEEERVQFMIGACFTPSWFMANVCIRPVSVSAKHHIVRSLEVSKPGHR